MLPARGDADDLYTVSFRERGGGKVAREEGSAVLLHKDGLAAETQLGEECEDSSGLGAGLMGVTIEADGHIAVSKFNLRS